MSGMNVPRLQVSAPGEGADNYTAALERAGGDPVSACCPAPDLSCAGLVLCGGGDIACEFFGQEDRGSNPPDLARDRAELALFQAFYRAGKPILGICRGMQIINVALGGTLIQDLPQPQRDFHTWEGADKIHPVACLEGSLLHRLYGPLCSVNSAHHQGLDRLGEGLRTIAWSEGGVAEAVDLPGYPLLGVQFHPERMAGPLRRPDTVDGGAILHWFLEICRKTEQQSPGP